MFKKIAKIFFTSTFAFAILFHSASAENSEYKEEDVVSLYQEAFENFNRGSFYFAGKLIDQVRSEYPYSSLYQKSFILKGLIEMFLKKYDKADEVFKNYIILYEKSPEKEITNYIKFLFVETCFQEISRMKYQDEPTILRCIERIDKTDKNTQYIDFINANKQYLISILLSNMKERISVYEKANHKVAQIRELIKLENFCEKNNLVEEKQEAKIRIKSEIESLESLVNPPVKS